MRQRPRFVFRPGLILLVALATGGAFSAQTPEYPDIKNFLRVDEHFCTGGQPTMDDLVRMKKGGIRTILNLRRPEEFNARQEATQAEKLGLRYFLIPIDPKHPQDEQVEEFLKILADPQNLPVFVHCHTANRVGALWLIRRVLVDGWPMENAGREAERIGLSTPELRDFARDYIRRHAEDPVTP